MCRDRCTKQMHAFEQSKVTSLANIRDFKHRRRERQRRRRNRGKTEERTRLRREIGSS